MQQFLSLRILVSQGAAMEIDGPLFAPTSLYR